VAFWREPPAASGAKVELALPESAKGVWNETGVILEGEEMSRLSFVLLILTGLFAYFGTAAWRLSDDSHVDVTGQIRPTAK
jgi:hypothetical protein